MATGDDTDEKTKHIELDIVKIDTFKQTLNKDYEIAVEQLFSEEKLAFPNKEPKGITEGEPVEGYCKKSGELSETESRIEVSTCLIGSCPKVDVVESPPIKLEKERRIKLGHRRVRSDGQVTYKNILTSKIVDSITSGIEHAITGQASKSNRDLLMQDFMTVESTMFSSNATLVRRSRFVFKTYAPTAFRYFRQLFGIRPKDFLESFCSEPLKELSHSGKSGSLFYLTGNDRFIVKTMLSKECSFLQKLLPGYYLNLHQNPNTLLPKYFGLYCYQCDMKKIKLVVMNNILPSSINIDQRYDLKGATYKSRATRKGAIDSTYKDLDFMAHHPGGLYLESETYNALMKTIKRDCTVLESFKIMDYSLLLGICKANNWRLSPNSDKKLFSTETEPERGCKGQDPPLQAKGLENTETTCEPRWSMTSDSTKPKPDDDRMSGLFHNEPFPHGGLSAIDGDGEPLVIFVGIIDILQSYKFKKKMEHAFKSIIHNGDTVSVHNPCYYSSRFQKFMADKVFRKLSPPVKRKGVKQPGFKSLSPASVENTRGHTSFNSNFVFSKLSPIGSNSPTAEKCNKQTENQSNELDIL